MDAETAVPNTTELTRVPQQARSREKFDAILAAALRLIHEKGYEQVSVREIAREVNLPIASVYQYFPNKLAIVRQLWEGYTSELAELLGGELALVAQSPSEATLRRAVGNIIDHMVAHHRDNPAFLGIWRSVDGSPELRALNRQDTLRVADAIGAAVQRVHPDADPQTVMNRSLIACETASATVKLAPELPAERLRGLYDNLKSVLISMFAEVT
ncbi:MAG: TetR/AcrR family transcriptional regulator [Polyangiales bacterium]